jgi:cell wall-associated NlpC family hydrolase
VASLRDILAQAGFSGSSLNTAYAIAMAESGGNARAFNGNVNTGDESYGLFQVNMLGGMGPERRQQYGLSSNDDLYDAEKNAQVAYKMSKGGTDWSPWSTYKRGDYKKYLGQSGAEVTVSPGSKAQATPGQTAAKSALDAEKGAPTILGAQIAPGLAAQDADPVAPDKGDPFAAPKGDPVGTPQAAPKSKVTGNLFTGAPSSSFRDKVIASAMMQLGTPYSWGGGGADGASRGFAQGAGTVGFDCSSLMMYAFAKAGYSLPRVSWDQLKQGQRTSVDNLQAGDLVGFRDGSHIALYLGDGKILEAPHTGANVRVRSLGSNEDAWGVHLSLPGD